MVFSISSIEDESRLADTLVVQLANLKLSDKQRILESQSTQEYRDRKNARRRELYLLKTK